MKLKLSTTAAELEHLYDKANGRGGNATVTRTALLNLLIDYGKMRDALPEQGVEFKG